MVKPWETGSMDDCFGLTSLPEPVRITKEEGTHARVLVCAPSNSALDELLRRILRDGIRNRYELKSTLVQLHCYVLLLRMHICFCVEFASVSNSNLRPTLFAFCQSCSRHQQQCLSMSNIMLLHSRHRLQSADWQ